MAPNKIDQESVGQIAQAVVKSLKDSTEFREFVKEAAKEGAKKALGDFFGTSEQDAEGLDINLQYYLTHVMEAVPDPEDETSSLIGLRGVVESADSNAKDTLSALNSLRSELDALVGSAGSTRTVSTRHRLWWRRRWSIGRSGPRRSR